MHAQLETHQMVYPLETARTQPVREPASSAENVDANSAENVDPSNGESTGDDESTGDGGDIDAKTICARGEQIVVELKFVFKHPIMYHERFIISESVFEVLRYKPILVEYTNFTDWSELITFTCDPCELDELRIPYLHYIPAEVDECIDDNYDELKLLHWSDQ